MRHLLLAIAGCGLAIAGSGCMSAGAHTPDNDRPRNMPSRTPNPQKLIQRGDQIYELFVPPAGRATHVVLPFGSISVGGWDYIPKGYVTPPVPEGSPAPSTPAPNGSQQLPFPQKMPDKGAMKSTPPTSLNRDKAALPVEDNEIPRAEIIGVRPMTPQEVAEFEKTKQQPPAAKLGEPMPESSPKELPKFDGPILGAPVPAFPEPKTPTPTITPPPGALPPAGDWTPVPPPPATDLPPRDDRPKRIRPELTTSLQRQK